ncbi:uncharacterized protein LOC113362230 [Papaver somniferum]|uniref:uncharacterized protein LOC113362230 n=1 Tax=Papaver somniferum TaxID=3469 RepID=UPI000E7003F7|nr:uncharacterized protein LOC113362230 [Papaver somniferum]
MDENKFKNLATAVSNIGTKQDGLQKEVSNMITGFKKDMKDFCAAFISRLNQLAKNGGKIYDDASNCSNVNQNHVVQNIQNVETEDHRMVLQYIHKEDDVQNIDIVDTEDRRMGSKEIHKYGNALPSYVIRSQYVGGCYPTVFFNIFKEVEDTWILWTKIRDLFIFHISDFFDIFEEKSDNKKSCPPLQVSSKFEIQFSDVISNWVCLQIYLELLSYLRKVVGDQYAGRYRGRLGTAFPFNLLRQVCNLEVKVCFAMGERCMVKS